MEKWQMYKDGQIKLTQDEILKYQFAESRHKEIENLVNLIKLPYTIYSTLRKLLSKKYNTLRNIENLKNLEKEVSRLKLVMESKERAKKMKNYNWDDINLKSDGIFSLGINDYYENVDINFSNFSNLLIGGEPGGGKTKLIQLLIYQALKHNATVDICDFKGLDYIKLRDKTRLIDNHNDFIPVLKRVRAEIDKRKSMFVDVGAENLKHYNEITGNKLKRYYLVIDELAEAFEPLNLDKSAKKQFLEDVNNTLGSIARLGRAYGINIIAGTQRPDVSIIKGQIRDQFTMRICFKSIKNTSLIVLGNTLAEELPDKAGIAIVRKRTDFIKTQIYLFNPDSFLNLNNKKIEVLTKETQDIETIMFDEDNF